MTRLPLTRRAPQHIEHYAEQTRRVVDDLAAQLQVLFEDERAGRMSPSWARTLDRLFALWCEQSGVVPTDTARRVLGRVDAFSLVDVLKAVRVELGFSSEEVAQACEEYVARTRAGRDPARLLRRLEQRLYRPQIRSLCIQSAHVTLARAVLYRVLEDGGIAQTRISGPPLAAALGASTQGLVGAPSVFRLLEDMRSGTEDFLPSLYQRRELDWWLIDFPSSRSRRALFDQRMGAVEVELARMLQILDGYDFAGVDQDVWRDVYDHHLPSDERQRLGSFYTPDAIVRSVLDLAGWGDSDAIGDATIADISCGSGAFLVEALRRRRSALAQAGRLPSDPTPEQLDHLVAGVAGLDIHPFATFLASVNLLFQVIDLYESVRRRHRGYSLPLNVFTVDALEDTGVHPRQAQLQQEIPDDIRVRHTEQEIERYRGLRALRFDVVVGNPPWGGVLKGRLSPLNDPEKRREYATNRFDSATGKYDIFVLFVERSIRWLRDGGHYGFVVPSAYRDRDFGQGLRQFLADEGPPTTIVDLLPFGTLLFRAMNTPTLLAGTRTQSNQPLQVISVGQDLVFAAPPHERERRQGQLYAAVQAALAGRADPGVVAYVEPEGTLRSWGRRPWPLDSRRPLRAAVERAGDAAVGDIFQSRQGVTPGGEGVLHVLQLPPDRAAELGLESDVLHPVAQGTELQAGAARPATTVLLYPYVVTADGWRRAFDVEAPGGELWDALDPEPQDAAETALVAGLHDRERHRRLVERRMAEGICPYPAAAEYLLDHYDLLASRRPEGAAITQGGKRWWEYHRPRDPVTMLTVPKLLGPRRGMLWPRFALDEQGLLPTDPVVTLSKPASTLAQREYARIQAALSDGLGGDASDRDVLVYLIAFLNAVPSAVMLRIGRLPTAKGGWVIDDAYLASVRVAVPGDAGLVRELWERADLHVARTSRADGAHDDHECLDDLVGRALGLSALCRRELAAWAADVRPPSEL